MKTTERIIDEYLQADFETRMNLFLQYPGFREDFTHIEMVESADNDAGDSVPQMQSRTRGIAPQLKKCWHFCRLAFARW